MKKNIEKFARAKAAKDAEKEREKNPFANIPSVLGPSTGAKPIDISGEGWLHEARAQRDAERIARGEPEPSDEPAEKE